MSDYDEVLKAIKKMWTDTTRSTEEIVKDFEALKRELDIFIEAANNPQQL